VTEAEFQRALTVVLGGGAIIMGVATIVLALAFRSYGTKKPRMGLIAGLVAFLFVCCAILLALSYGAR
jgi:uncharacterized membrane protein HdeD (DUF308 family)